MGEKHKNDKPLEHERMEKEDFVAGSPYSLWLKEELTGEIYDYLNGNSNRGLIQKYGLKVNKENKSKICNDIMNIRKFDHLQGTLRKMAVDIIRMELDPDFEG